jgi:hypothetical protein
MVCKARFLVTKTRPQRGSTDNNLYCKIDGNNTIIVELYVDDIIFDSDDEKMSKDFARMT